jgi:hypothetical protein
MSSTSKTSLQQNATLAITLALICCVTSCSGHQQLRSLDNQILRLKSGERYAAQADETWHSDGRFRALEQELINATAALKQSQNR